MIKENYGEHFYNMNVYLLYSRTIMFALNLNDS